MILDVNRRIICPIFKKMFQIFNPALDGGRPRRRREITNEIAGSRRLTSRCSAHNINDLFLIQFSCKPLQLILNLPCKTLVFQLALIQLINDVLDGFELKL